MVLSDGLTYFDRWYVGPSSCLLDKQWMLSRNEYNIVPQVLPKWRISLNHKIYVVCFFSREVNSGFFYKSASERETLVQAERAFIDARVQKIIGLKKKVCDGNNKGFVVINQKVHFWYNLIIAYLLIYFCLFLEFFDQDPFRGAASTPILDLRWLWATSLGLPS